MRNLLALVLTSVLAVACQGNPVAPAAQPPPVPDAPPPLPAAPKAVLSVGRGDSTPPFAVVNFTPLLFDASRSEGDGLTYLVEYGDGASSTEPVTTRRVNGSPTAVAPRTSITAKLTVTDRHGRTDSTTQPYFLVSVHTGIGYGMFWHGDPQGDGAFLNVQLTQDGATLYGNYWGWDNRRTINGSVAGVLTDDRAIRLKTVDGAIEFIGTVELRGSPDAYPGAWPDTILRLSMKGGPLNGSAVEFEFADPY
jgi:hypothetical protein